MLVVPYARLDRARQPNWGGSEGIVNLKCQLETRDKHRVSFTVPEFLKGAEIRHNFLRLIWSRTNKALSRTGTAPQLIERSLSFDERSRERPHHGLWIHLKRALATPDIFRVAIIRTHEIDSALRCRTIGTLGGGNRSRGPKPIFADE
jgi:hypothetical protein